MMMANADDGSTFRMEEYPYGDDGESDVTIDLDYLCRVLDEPPDSEQDGLEELPLDDGVQGLPHSKAEVSKITEVVVLSPSYNCEASEYRSGCSDGFIECPENSVSKNGEIICPSSWLSCADNACSTNMTDYNTAQSYCNTYLDGSSSSTSSYSLIHGIPRKLIDDSIPGVSNAQMEDAYGRDKDRSLYDASHIDSSSGEVARTDISDFLSENGDLYLSSLGDMSCFSPSKQDCFYNYGFESLAKGDDQTNHTMNESTRSTEYYFSLSPVKDLSRIESRDHIGNSRSESLISLNSEVPPTMFSEMHGTGNDLELPTSTFSNVLGNMRDQHVNCKKINGSITSSDLVSRASEVDDGIICWKYNEGMSRIHAREGMKPSSFNSAFSLTHKNNVFNTIDKSKHMILGSKEALLSLGSAGKIPIKNPTASNRDFHRILPVPKQHSKFASVSSSMENYAPKFTGSYLTNTTSQSVQNNSFEDRSVDDDCDVCIIEDMSAPARTSTIALNANKSVVSSQLPTPRTPFGQMVAGHPRFKPNAEHVIFNVALQDLSQPKSEADPPDGALTVSLLKHQRIALSWMVNKETKSACCSGGILADDQGLGKTVSTIALILKERFASSKAPKTNEEVSEAETLNLDDDDDRVFGEGVESVLVNGYPINGAKTCVQAKGRPAAGTLIVCPTSVLRQWSDELQNKVTREADLSVLVYHGSNRTKDPLELAKFDVVVTTYAIVSMEVPKQPIVDENDDKIGTPFKGFSSGKKRNFFDSDKPRPRSKKSKKGIDAELFETISGPLAKVGWFRVVLDEAQSIKNHRTQVARACWGLRAKRRWCLSGTPIQNAIDDLYSYFRFLRHEPYAVFRTFCEHIKTPIHRNPKDGYKKLQAVLKTIMLRRTKGTLLDGEPIINLPPKTIEMKRVDFSTEERDFYGRLEAESRAQFAEYAAAGTVKQNYVNILLMLLRLRQACDHPLLVKGFNSNPKMTPSIAKAKELPREKQNFLLTCLEASLAICGICSDPPEDAVVSVCGHVYCNQCIYQHIIGDDTQCPTRNCRTHLSLSHIFSITSLRSSLSGQLNEENISMRSDSVKEVCEPTFLNRPEDSSKIKAALELLLSLSTPRDCSSIINSSEFLGADQCLEKLHVYDSVDNRNSHSSVSVTGEKAIVFSQWTRMLDLLETCLKNSSIQYRRLDGTMPVVARDKAVKDFNSLPQVSVMIMSLKAASLGLNMVAACHVLLLDLWWNPTTEDQAIDRAHRIGQTRPVSVFRLTVKDTVEDRILALQQRKREMVASAFGEDETGGRQTRLTVEDLKYLFRV